MVCCGRTWSAAGGLGSSEVLPRKGARADTGEFGREQLECSATGGHSCAGAGRRRRERARAASALGNRRARAARARVMQAGVGTSGQLAWAAGCPSGALCTVCWREEEGGRVEEKFEGVLGEALKLDKTEDLLLLLLCK